MRQDGWKKTVPDFLESWAAYQEVFCVFWASIIYRLVSLFWGCYALMGFTMNTCMGWEFIRYLPVDPVTYSFPTVSIHSLLDKIEHFPIIGQLTCHSVTVHSCLGMTGLFAWISLTALSRTYFIIFFYCKQKAIWISCLYKITFDMSFCQ